MPLPPKKTVEVPKSAKQRIYEELKKWIVDGELKPGEKIYDSEIAQYFSVSRTPVREAIQLLADQKLIEVFPGRESRVSEIGVVDVDQIYKMLGELHALALEFAYPAIDRKVINQLKKINEKILSALESGSRKDARAYDQEFHEVFFTLSSNDFLTSFAGTLESHIDRIENIYYDKLGERRDSVQGHETVIAALENSDLTAAKEAARQNWLHVSEVLKEDELN